MRRVWIDATKVGQAVIDDLVGVFDTHLVLIIAAVSDQSISDQTLYDCVEVDGLVAGGTQRRKRLLSSGIRAPLAEAHQAKQIRRVMASCAGLSARSVASARREIATARPLRAPSPSAW